MKKSQFRNMIREEIKTILNEDSLSMVPEWPEEVQAYDMDVVFVKVEEHNNGNATYDIINVKTNEKIGEQYHGSVKQLKDSANNFVIPLGGTQSSQF